MTSNPLGIENKAEQVVIGGLSKLDGKGGSILMWLVGLASSAIVGYYSAQAVIEARVTKIETAESNHFDELRRTIDDVKTDIRDLRGEVRTLTEKRGGR